MKILFFTLLMSWTLCPFAQSIKIGDNIKTEFSKILKKYTFDAPNLTPWAEAKGMAFIGSKPNPEDCEILYIQLKNKALIGVLKNAEPRTFLFDLDGHSVLSTATEFFILPEWTVKHKAKVSTTDRTFYNVLDRLYTQTLQADSNELDEGTMSLYRKFQTDTSLPNRHLAVLFDTYQTILSETASQHELAPAEICLPLMKTLASEFMLVYKSIPVIVYVYQGEALESAGKTDEARQHFNQALKVYPNSIPLQVHCYMLEQDSEKKKKELAELKAKHPNHWMVKDL